MLIMLDEHGILNVRPYQLMCIICKLGAGKDFDKDDTTRLSEIYRILADTPLQMVRLCCNVDAVYFYQNPGTADDSPEGELLNLKRDLDIMQRLGLIPGDVRPAHELFNRLTNAITGSDNICGYARITSPEWRECPDAHSGNYGNGIKNKVIDKIFPPRTKEDIASVKKLAIKQIEETDEIRLIPMHFMCLACYHKGDKQPVPIEEDLLFEVWDKIRRQPDIPVRIVRKDCMVCQSCVLFDTARKMCVRGGKIGAELRQLQKELNILQRLGLQFGDVVPANELFTRVFTIIPESDEICAYGNGKITAPEWMVCGNEFYSQGRQACLGIEGITCN